MKSTKITLIFITICTILAVLNLGVFLILPTHPIFNLITGLVNSVAAISNQTIRKGLIKKVKGI